MKNWLTLLLRYSSSLTLQIILLALVALTLSGCATQTYDFKPVQNPLPKTLIEKHLPDAQNYSQKAQDWLQKVKDFYSSMEQSTTQ
ncbi:MAG: hypothetical protein SOR95_08515 [Sutterella sp.]|nr:hypothetical protein [Sutterella sp.]